MYKNRRFKVNDKFINKAILISLIQYLLFNKETLVAIQNNIAKLVIYAILNRDKIS